jgi:hypothetical protein
LEACPQGLHATYDESLIRIQTLPLEDQVFAYQILLWVAYAKRPLNAEEVVTAALNYKQPPVTAPVYCPEQPVDADKWPAKVIEGTCFQLVEVEGRIVKFRHFSVKESLLRRRTENLSVLNNPHLELLGTRRAANECLGQACLTYLLSPCFRHNFDHSTQKNSPPWSKTDYTASDFAKSEQWMYSLLAYASNQGLSHLEDIGNDFSSNAILQELLREFVTEKSLLSWLSISSVWVGRDWKPTKDWFRSATSLSRYLYTSYAGNDLTIAN